MSKVSYEIIRNDERLFFHDGEKYVLFDTGFFYSPMGKNSRSVNGGIGPFRVSTQEKSFFTEFINLQMGDGAKVTAVFNPMDGYNCMLQGNTLTITDEETDPPAAEHFLEFVIPWLPVVEGQVNGHSCRLLFDSGARMTMIGDRALIAEAEKTGTYREWMAMKREYADLQVFKIDLKFPCGAGFAGSGALVEDPAYTVQGRMMNIKAMLGIDIFRHYDLFIAAKGKKRGIALMHK